jgi:heme-degrading monooxygenase HmoA
MCAEFALATTGLELFAKSRDWKVAAANARNGEPAMFAVIFELQPKQEKFDEYLTLAKYLRPILEAIDGFIDIDRFASKRTKGRLLSLSTWRDEKAVVRWRTHAEHHAVQEKGRFDVFEDYHLRVGEIMVDTAPPKGFAVQEQRFDATDVGEVKAITITELVPQEDNALGAKVCTCTLVSVPVQTV